MLSFRLTAGATASGWRATADGLAAGAARITPYRHAALEELTRVAPGRLFVCVRERAAGFGPPFRSPAGAPPAELADLSLHAWEAERAALARWPLQSAVLDLRDRGHQAIGVTLTAGGWGTAPVFLVADATELHGHWDPTDLYPRLRRSCLDVQAAARFLATLESRYAQATMFGGLALLTERAVATWEPTATARAALTIEYPRPVRRLRTQPLRPGADVVGRFADIVTAVVGRWAATAEHAALGAELSGGLDSAIVAAAARRLTAGPIRSYGLALTANTADQRARRTELAALLDLDDTELRLDRFPPLGPRLPDGPGRPVVPWEEIYYEAADALIAAAVDRGTTTMLTGFGGDELCGLRPGELRQIRAEAGTAGVRTPSSDRSPEAGRFLSPAALGSLAEAVDRAPGGAAADSAIETAAFGASMYMRRGVWPIHPLCAPELVRFCDRLPVDWRTGRLIERRLLERLGCSPTVTHPAIADDFSPALASSLRHQARPILAGLFREPLLAELGIVDAGRLVESYRAWCATGHDDDATTYYAAAILELTLRALG